MGSLFSHVGSEAGSAFKSIMTGSEGAGAAVAGLASALGPIAIAAVAIGIGAFFMKKAWDVNMGGMQSKTAKFFAMIHKDWAIFNADLNKSMKNSFMLTGFIDGLVFSFSVIYNILKLIGKTVKLAFDLTVIGMFITLMDKLAEKFGWANDQANSLKKVMEIVQGIGKGFGLFDAVDNIVDNTANALVEDGGKSKATEFANSVTDSRIFNLYTQEHTKDNPSFINFLADTLGGRN
jgi:hypothetical protein